MTELKMMLANNLSNFEWTKGIGILEKNRATFFALVPATYEIDIAAGTCLQFAYSGKCTIQKIQHLSGQSEAFTSLFVTVDKNLNPILDGFPNPIYYFPNK